MEFQALTVTTQKQLSIVSHMGLFQSTKGFLIILVLSFILFCLATCGPCVVDVEKSDACPYNTDGSDKSSQGTLFGDASGAGENPTHLGFEGVCTNSGSFCFPSTLPGFLSKEKASELEVSWGQSDGTSAVGSTEDVRLTNNKSWSADYGMFELFEGGIVSCSLNSRESVNELLSIQKTDSNKQHDFSSCRGPLVNHKTASLRPNEDHKEIKSKLDSYDSSFSPHVDVSPTMLDWGQKYIYLPSLASLTVANTCNDSILHIYEPFSTDPQFYPYNFSEASIGPGEVASFYFVFLPRWLGFSSAHLVLQTNFGGFLVQAKGFTIQSTYRIEPLLGLDISSGGTWNKLLSLFNPSDETLYVEKVTAWLSVSQGDTFHYAEAICSIESIHGSDEAGVLSLKERLVRRSDHVGWPLVSIRPYKHWKIGPGSNQTIVEMDFSVKSEGKVLGAFCVQLLRSSQDNPDTIMIPLEAELEEKAVYNDLGSVSASLEPLKHNENVFVTIALKNSAPYMLSVLQIIEDAGNEVFQVKYMEGLLLFPGAITQVAVVTCTALHVQLHESLPEIFNMYKDCKLLILTNDSSSSKIEVSCHYIIHLCSRSWKDSSVGSGWQSEHSTLGNRRTGSLGSHMPLHSQKDLEGAEAGELVLENWKSQGTMRGMYVLDEHEVSFPMVEVGSHCSRWIIVNNPSEQPVVMQLILNSGEIIDECQSPDNSIEPPSGGSAHNESTMQITHGFSIAEGAVTEAYVHPYSRASFGPIIFHPSARCGWKSSALIRNNLSGVEWLSLGGFGGSLSLLVLEGFKPVQSIEFNLDLPVPLNVSSLESLVRLEETACACSQPLLKELYANNTGDLPLEVKRIEISGTECELDGFSVQNCEAFSLKPGESKKLLISYQTNFSASVVHRDLEFALGTGMLVIPMKVSLPFHMVNYCRKSVIWMQLKKFLLAVLLACLIFIVFCWVFPYALSLSSIDNSCKSEKSSNATSVGVMRTFSLQHNKRHSKLSVNNLLGSGGKEKTLMQASVCKYPEGRGEIPIQGLTAHNEKPTIENDRQTNDWSSAEKERVLHSCLCSNSLVIEDSDIMEASHPNYLKIKTGKERGRRRRKRNGTGAKFTGLFEVSSSQSGNSTPSSPLSPFTFGTPKRMWPVSPNVDQFIETCSPFTQVADKEPGSKATPGFTDTKFAEAETLRPSCNVLEPKVSVENCTNNLILSNKEQLLESRRISNKPVLLPSATFPSASNPVKNVLCSSSPYASATTISPNARAPGSRFLIQKTSDEEEKARVRDEYTYDIWGDHFSGLHLTGKSKDAPSMISTTVEKDSNSFFVSGPQTLIAKSQPVSVSSLYQQG